MRLVLYWFFSQQGFTKFKNHNRIYKYGSTYLILKAFNKILTALFSQIKVRLPKPQTGVPRLLLKK
jgi:hypothetical protein